MMSCAKFLFAKKIISTQGPWLYRSFYYFRDPRLSALKCWAWRCTCRAFLAWGKSASAYLVPVPRHLNCCEIANTHTLTSRKLRQSRPSIDFADTFPSKTVMLVNKKPKFRFSFTINDLSKIPHTSGYCYAELSIADGSPSGFRAALALLKPFSSLTKESSSSDISPMGSGASTPTSENKVSAHSSSRCILVRTLKYRIHNFKSHFNFSMTCNLKFLLRKKDEMVGDKHLVLRVYYIAEKHAKHDHPMELGVVRLNLAEYLNFNEPVTAKYLLQESKVNSILNLTVSLEELPADFDFHTQLSIDDSKRSLSKTNSSMSITKASENSSKSYKVPQFQRQAVFGGLDGVINPHANKESGQNLPDQQTETSSLPQDDDADKEDLEENESKHPSQPNRHMTTVGTKAIDDVIVDPVIGSLYRKILESTWDPDLHVLLKLTPQKVVEDIFDMDKDPSKMENNLQHYRNLRPSNDDHGIKNADGLIVESKFRNNLTSWSVSWT